MKWHKYYAVVICRTCGIQPLSEKSYEEQFRNADAKWECPQCGQNAEWDDHSLATNPQEGAEK